MPLRVEVGPRDVQKEQVVLARRDVVGKAGKSFVPMAGLEERAPAMLAAIQQALYDRALAFREANTVEATAYDEIVATVGDKFVRAYWCGDPQDEVRLKEDTKVTIRCIPLDQDGQPGVCAICGKPASEKVILARAY